MAEQFDLIVRNGTLVSGKGRRAADIGIRAGRLAAIELPGSLDGNAGRDFDASGHFVLPGLIDGHVHFREPGLEHKEDWLTGSRAAVMGGITTVLEMPNTLPPTDSMDDARAKARLADEKSYCDFGLLGLLGSDNLGELSQMAASGLVVGVKVFLGPTTGSLAAPSDEVLLGALSVCRQSGMRVGFHAEDAGTIRAAERELRASGRSDALAHLVSRPVAAELRAIDHAARLLAEAGTAGHILHVSSADGLSAIESWRSRGLDLSCEVTAHHSILSVSDYAGLQGTIKCNPPVRESADGAALLAGLADGRVDCIASDHAPHAPDEKQATDIWQVAPGIAGVETSLRLFLTHGVHAGRLSLEQLVRAFAERPAQVWGLWPRKGAIEVGSDADLTIVDMQHDGVIRGSELHGKHGLTPFEGWPTRGTALATIVRGRVVMEEGRLLAEPGWGRLVERQNRPALGVD
jgi:dihydroorotase